MAQVRPTELSIVQAAAGVIGLAGLTTKIVPRWILGLEPGEAIPHLAPKDIDNNLLPISAWVATVSSWIPAKIRSQKGYKQTPTNFTPGFDDTALDRDYKIAVAGSLKIWQLLQYKQGDNDYNSEYASMIERQLVIDYFTMNPRLTLEWGDFEHDELKFPAIIQIPFNDSLLHVAQGNVPFTFSYVVTAT